MARAIVMKVNDNVATAMSNIKSGETVTIIGPGYEKKLQAQNEILFGHKIAITRISTGANVMKYGESIGSAFKDIAEGEHVHLHNLMSNRGRGDLAKLK